MIFNVVWNATILANSKEEAAELAAAILFDQAQEIISIRVDNEVFDIKNGIAFKDQ